MTIRPDPRRELGAFLRAHRERTPGSPRARTRTPGLRREDVAEAAHISVDYYTRLEQARARSMPSPPVTDAIGRVLGLTPDERQHLHRLAGRPAPELTVADETAPGLAFLLERLVGTPAQVVSDLGVVLAQNDAADRLFEWVVAEGLGSANVYERWFCHAEVRAAFPPSAVAAYSEAQAGELRAAAARRAVQGDDAGHRYVDALCARSPEFARAWAAGHTQDGRDKALWVGAPGGSVGLRAHVTIDDRTGQRLVAFETSRQAP